MSGSIERNGHGPLLSIAIPTHNRSGYLRELLQSLQGDLQNESRVELVVSDNCSSDDTPAIIADFISRGMQIRSFRNETNIGADANFLQCFDLTKGTYLWIIGDDDLVVPGAVPAILGKCATKEYDMIYLSQFAFKRCPVELDRKEIKKCAEICDPRDYARRINVFFTFISANIVNRETIAKSGALPFSDLIGTNLGQLGWTYAALDGFKKGLFVYDELVGARENFAGGYKLFDVFGPKLKEVTRARIRSKAVRDAILGGTIRHFLPIFALKCRRSAIASGEKGSIQARLTPAFRSYAQYWIILYPVLVLPYLLAGGWYFLFRSLDRLGARVRRWRETAA